MPRHAERRVLPYTPEQLFGLVAGIEKYPEFLPWCMAARVRSRTPVTEGELVVADLVIGFKVFRERFTSKVTLNPAARTIDVAYADGPFKYLTNRWIFEPDERGCTVDFSVDFEFRNRLLQKTIELLFHEAVKRMVGAFEARAAALFGPKAVAPSG
jgi:coenzyme Q-binding protein COQ10